MSRFQREEQGPTWQQLLEMGRDSLLEAGIAEAELDAWYLLESSFAIDQVHFLLDRNRTVNRERFEKFYPMYLEYIEKRASRIPIQYILGNQEFMGLNFTVNESVLIPRQDTEKLVETVLREHKDRHLSVLDMCTGSGCIAVSLSVLGGYDKMTAVDISKEALSVAKKNARRHFLVQKGTVRSESSLITEQPWKLRMSTYVYAADKSGEATGPRGAVFSGTNAGEMTGYPVSSGKKGTPGITAVPGVNKREFVLMESNLFSNLEPEEKFDIVVSNPPYIPSSVIDALEPEVKDHEPRLALDGMKDGLHFYRMLAYQSRSHIKAGGYMYFEIGCDQAAAVEELLATAGFVEILTIKDEPGLDRVVRACWKG